MGLVYAVVARVLRRRSRSKRDDGIPVKVVKNIPTRVQEPANADEIVGTKSAIGEVGNHSRERELPHSKSSIEIGGSRTRDHDGVEVSSARLSKKGTGADIDKRDQHRAN